VKTLTLVSGSINPAGQSKGGKDKFEIAEGSVFRLEDGTEVEFYRTPMYVKPKVKQVDPAEAAKTATPPKKVKPTARVNGKGVTTNEPAAPFDMNKLAEIIGAVVDAKLKAIVG
jgi:hypothetical protein